MAHAFRLITDIDAAGAFRNGAANMALDEAISQAVSAGLQPPTVRFYGWAPPAISLGTSQRIRTVDTERCATDGVGIVRRSTGGLAILHTDEFTYSVALPVGHALAQGDVLTSYQRISTAILLALTRLGVRDVRANRVAKEDKAQGPVCFEAPSDYEVVGQMPDGVYRKLAGSAQWRRVDGVLQHGSLPLRGDIARVCRYLHGAPDPELVRARAGTLADATGREWPWADVARVWRGAFELALDITFDAGAPSAGEIQRMGVLVEEKYGNDAWTGRR
jgi:lipoyl(octanoyl) transferase